MHSKAFKIMGFTFNYPYMLENIQVLKYSQIGIERFKIC
jgi:hypothetical protein